MPRGDKSSYTDKQKRKAEHIEEGYEKRGVGKKEAEARAWATVNKESGGGNKSGSGRGKNGHPCVGPQGRAKKRVNPERGLAFGGCEERVGNPSPRGQELETARRVSVQSRATGLCSLRSSVGLPIVSRPSASAAGRWCVSALVASVVSRLSCASIVSLQPATIAASPTSTSNFMASPPICRAWRQDAAKPRIRNPRRSFWFLRSDQMRTATPVTAMRCQST